VLAANEVFIPLKGSLASTGVRLRIAILPKEKRKDQEALWQSDEQPEIDVLSKPVEVLEGSEYRYQWLGLSPSLGSVTADPEELFQADGDDGLTGRFRPRLSTGSVQVVLRSGPDVLGELELEVRSRKLAYRSEYQWMLRDIAERMAELVMHRFAAGHSYFRQDGTADAVTLYQRFAFLRAVFERESFQVAVREILRRPHTEWEEEVYRVRPGEGMRGSSHVIRQIVKGGGRSSWDGGTISSLPNYIERKRTEATHDTTPNRFIKFALEHWREILCEIDRRLAEGAAGVITSRGRREIAVVLMQLDEILHHELFSDLKPITRFPAENQVLQKREGYRDVFRAYVEFELASRLSWRNEEDAHGAGVRDVATLYEYWAFIQLAQMVAELIGQSFDMSPLLAVQSDGLNVALRSGTEIVLKGNVARLDRRMTIELCFNRTYGVNSEKIGSWTRPMRPDYSLLIYPAADESAVFEPIALHFDAKYRVDFVKQLFGNEDETIADKRIDQQEGELIRGGPRRDDLLKMHAYRDAIRRTAGAYILYPGGDGELNRGPFTEYHELLPGLGAFVLRPTLDGTASGTSVIKRFLSDTLEHVATRLTQHERGRFWAGQIYRTPSPRNNSLFDSTDELDLETTILLGFVKSEQHWNWIAQRATYNVRDEGRAGGVRSDAQLWASQLILLYCPSMERVALARIVSEPESVSSHGMTATGYPTPNGRYWCVQISSVDRPDWVGGLTGSAIERCVQTVGHLRGAPVTMSWRAICATRFESMQRLEQ
jgi:predicted component of viral defense system (DUF524 family)